MMREQNLFFRKIVKEEITHLWGLDIFFLYQIILEQGLRRLNTLNTRKKFNIAGFFVSAEELEMMVLEQPCLLN